MINVLGCSCIRVVHRRWCLCANNVWRCNHNPQVQTSLSLFIITDALIKIQRFQECNFDSNLSENSTIKFCRLCLRTLRFRWLYFVNCHISQWFWTGSTTLQFWYIMSLSFRIGNIYLGGPPLVKAATGKDSMRHWRKERYKKGKMQRKIQ